MRWINDRPARDPRLPLPTPRVILVGVWGFLGCLVLALAWLLSLGSP